MYLSNRRLKVVFQLDKLNGASVEQDVAGAIVIVTRLAHRSDIDDRLSGSDAVAVVHLGRGAIGHVLGPDSRDMGVSDKAEVFDLREDALHLVWIPNVGGVDVLAGGVGGRAMHEHDAVALVDAGHGSHVVPPTRIVRAVFAEHIELAGRPLDRLGCAGVESLRLCLEQHGLLVVAEQAEAELRGEVEAFLRVISVIPR